MASPENPYRLAYDYSPNKQLWYVEGPGDGMCAYGGTLWPQTRFETKELAEQAVYIANTAHAAGVRAAQGVLREAIFGALGVKTGHLNQLTLF